MSSCCMTEFEDPRNDMYVCLFVCMYVCKDQNEYCIAVCTELKEQAENDPNFISSFITGDESWVLGYN